ncbi:MAG TPA: FkbM family methyltransferase [Candidatus Limnocylindrales bacterium]|jgi:FkbM family methyltransferase
MTQPVTAAARLRSIARQALALIDLQRIPHAKLRRPPTPTPPRPANPHLTLASHLAALLGQWNVELVLDVGGNVGTYGQLLRRAGYAGRIASFEPVASAFDELSRAASDDPLWSVYHMALGRESGTRSINVMQKTAQSSFLVPSDLGRELIPTLQTASEEQVDMRRLDELYDEVAAPMVSPRTYLKMDTQGFDLEVVAGASGCLASVVGLQSELSVQALYEGMPPWLEALGEFERLGFKPTGFYPVGRDTALRLLECDCVMARIS